MRDAPEPTEANFAIYIAGWLCLSAIYLFITHIIAPVIFAVL